jgi:hypothetical protein
MPQEYGLIQPLAKEPPNFQKAEEMKDCVPGETNPLPSFPPEQGETVDPQILLLL